MEDEQIIRLFDERSERAITELEKKYGQLCRRISYRILKNEEDARECVNDTLLTVWNLIPPQKPVYLQAYVGKIARNISLKRYHANTAQKRNNHYDLLLEEIMDCLESGRSVEEEILARELAEQINDFLGGLKKKDRVMFVQRYWYASSFAEIARDMDMRENAVRVRLHRIREKLKRFLEGKGL